jgi:hypothetical protein
MLGKNARIGFQPPSDLVALIDAANKSGSSGISGIGLARTEQGRSRMETPPLFWFFREFREIQRADFSRQVRVPLLYSRIDGGTGPEKRNPYFPSRLRATEMFPEMPDEPNDSSEDAAMDEKSQGGSSVGRNQRTTMVYSKAFAYLGLACGFVILAGTWLTVLFWSTVSRYEREWLSSLPEWTVPTLLCVGSVSGLLLIFVSTVFGVLIPSRVIREDTSNKTREHESEQTEP